MKMWHGGIVLVGLGLIFLSMALSVSGTSSQKEKVPCYDGMGNEMVGVSCLREVYDPAFYILSGMAIVFLLEGVMTIFLGVGFD